MPSRVVSLALIVSVLLAILQGPEISPVRVALAQLQAVSEPDASEIATDAYIYLYPLITMDVTRRQMTNVEGGRMVGRGPINSFTHIRAFPTVEFRDIVRPNFDTLYSSGWVDLIKEPVIVSVPDTAGRYYLLPMLDMWTDVFAVPGKRTTGTAAGAFALVTQGWHGNLPAGVQRIESPTPYAWIIGRIQTNGLKDYAAVNKIQDGFRLTPLPQWGKTPILPAFKADPAIDMRTPPPEQVNAMTGARYFAYAAELLKVVPPHLTDQPMAARLKRLGFEIGKSFDPAKASTVVQRAIEQAPAEALKTMRAKAPTLARVVNGWQMNTDTMGVYGNDYLKRAIIAMVGLGANLPADAVYPLSIADADGKPLDGANNYVMHFEQSELPPVSAFWSVTMYDAAGYQVPNLLNRFAIGDRDPLKFNADGSLDLYIQSNSPGADREANWLPSPKSGQLGLTMRLYAPKPPVLEGNWAPPPVRRTQ